MFWLDVTLIVLIALGVLYLVIELRDRGHHRMLLSVFVVGLIAAAGWRAIAPGASLTTPVAIPGSPAPPVVVLAAGDIASCDSRGDEATANVLDEQSGLIFALGDTVYDDGTVAEYADCYDPSWGRHKDRTYPIPGNHEYGVDGAHGYFDYFGEAAGDPETGWYSFDVGAWHVVALNSVCVQLWGQTVSGRWDDGCAPGSPQEQWLRADLAAHPNQCTLALVHDPRFSSGSGISNDMLPFWQVFHEFGVDVVLSGDAHHYERFAPQDPYGEPDDVAGIRQFVVGTGGRSLQKFWDALPNSERQGTAYGVLKLTLEHGSYAWEFLPATGHDFTDAGTDTCR